MALPEYWRANGQSIVSRLVPYWLTVLAAAWSATFLYIWLVDDAWAFYDANFSSKVSRDMAAPLGTVIIAIL